MGHGKLRKFAENATFSCLLQPEAADVLDREAAGLRLKDHPIKGQWNTRMFSAPRPIVFELGCGKGDYTIALAERHPELNFIGVDIKGARLWKGAKYATEKGLGNVAFLRTRVEFITAFFAPGEVAEIWLTFSDPQLRGSENKRLSAPIFLERYRSFLRPGGRIHLKTDSRFLFEYTRAVAQENDLPLLACGTDIYHEPIQTFGPGAPDLTEVLEVQTFYESIFLKSGLPICYLCFTLNEEALRSPAAFDADYWRAQEGTRTFDFSAGMCNFTR